MPAPDPTRIYGVDFTSAPSRAKRIVIAAGHLTPAGFALESLESFHDWPAFDAWLAQPGPWVAGFDLPFGLPRELVQTLGWPTQWRALMQTAGREREARLRRSVSKGF